MTSPAPETLTRRQLLAGSAALGAAALSSRSRPALADTSAAGLSLGARAAAKGLLFGASFATQELDKPYGAAYAETYKREARMLTSEAEFKLYTLRPDAEKLNFRPADRLLAFARENGHVLHGHTLIWNDAVPGWIKDLAPDDVKLLLDMHIRTILGRYGAEIPTWDIVNEPIAPWDKLPGNLRNGPFYAAYGADYIATSYRLAREVAPAARLYLNEAQTESADDNGEVFRKSFLELLKRLKGEGVPVDGVGFESHLDSKRRYDFPRFAAFVEEIAAMGFEIAISELDINDHAWPADQKTRDRLVAGMYKNFLSAVLPVKAVKRLTLWQIADHSSWMYYDDLAKNPKGSRRPRPLPFDSAFKRKPAWDAIAEALDVMPAR